MSRAVLCFLFFFILNINVAQDFVWAKGLGGVDLDEGSSITVDHLGNVYTVGFFRGTVDFDPGVGIYNLTSNGEQDVFISKLDENGAFIWAKQIGGSLMEYGLFITIDPFGNIFITGSYMDSVDFDPGVGTVNITAVGLWDVFISKFDTDGNLIWVKSIGGTSGDSGKSIAFDNLGNIYCVGTFQGTADFDPGLGTFNLTSTANLDAFVAKLDVSGNFIWAKRFGGASFDYATSIMLDDFGYFYITGSFGNTVDFDPGPFVFSLTSAGQHDIYFSKFDLQGNFIWAKRIGGTSHDVGISIAKGNNGDFYIAGSFRGNVDFDPSPASFNQVSNGANDAFLSKFDSLGSFIWTISIGGQSEDQSEHIFVDNLENIYMIGYFKETVDFDSGSNIVDVTSSMASKDVFIVKYNALGNYEWVNCFGGYYDDEGFSVFVNGDGNIYSTGQFRDTVDFDFSNGVFNLESYGETDVFICKLINNDVSVLEIESNNISLYPNPTSSMLTISSNRSFQKMRIQLINSLGQVVYSEITSSSVKSIEIPNISGLYFVKLDIDGAEFCYKVIKY